MLHEMLLKDGITLATWGLAVVTGLLVVDSWRKGNDERQRWKRDDQFRRLQWLDTRFNSPGMIAARKRAASEMLEFKLSRQLGQPTVPVRPVIAFLTQIAGFCKAGLLDVREVDLAYRDHVMVVWSVYGRFLEQSFQNGRYASLSLAGR
jgi:hypothetical protein